jgi:hypothetical protein
MTRSLRGYVAAVPLEEGENAGHSPYPAITPFNPAPALLPEPELLTNGKCDAPAPQSDQLHFRVKFAGPIACSLH